MTSAVALQGDDGRNSRRAPKTKASRRPVPLHPLAADVVAAWKADGWRSYVGREPAANDPIFPNPRGEAWRPDSAPFLRDDLEAAGLATVTATGELIEFRSTRRSFTTWLDSHGLPGEVQDRLIRHVDASVRGRHYRGESPETLARLAAAVATIRLAVGKGDEAPAEESDAVPATVSDRSLDRAAPTGGPRMRRIRRRRRRDSNPWYLSVRRFSKPLP